MIDDTAIDQPEPESMESRIANSLGLGAIGQGDPDAEPAEKPEPEFAEIELDGEKYSIPAKLKDGFMKSEDYTRKTQDLAEQRRQYEHVKEIAQTASLERSFIDSIAGEREEMAVIDAYLKQTQQFNWANMSTEQMMRQKMEIDSIKERRQALDGSVRAKRQQFDETVKSKVSELKGKARELATKNITGFSEATEKSMRDYAKGEGLTEPEIDNILLDPRSFRVIYKAMQFDKVAAAAKEPVKSTKTVLKSGGTTDKMPASRAAELTFNKAMKSATTSGQKARVIEQRLANKFG